MTTALFIAITFLSSFVQGTIGIGYAIIYVTLGSFLFPYMEILVSERLLAILFMVPVLISFRNKIKWKYLLLPLVFSFLGTWIALKLLEVMNEVHLKMALGVVLAISGALNIFLKKDWHFKGTPVSGAIVGVVIGVLAGICGMAGPVLAMYFLGIDEMAHDKDCYFATNITLFELMGVYQTGHFLVAGAFPPGGWKLFLIGTIPTFIGMYMGLRLFKKIKVESVKRLLNYFMVVMGIFLFISNLIQLQG